jgi:ADP-heptose:LPS heptosyltransferase
MGFSLYKTLFRLWMKTAEDAQPVSQLKTVPRCFLAISHTALGDLLMSTAAIKSLKLSFPESRVLLVVHKNWLPLLENFPYADRIYPYEKGLFPILRLGRKLKQENPEVALVFHGNFPEDLTICRLSATRFVLKIKATPEYERLLSYYPKESNLHAIEKRLELVKVLGGRVILKEMDIGELKDLKIKNRVNQWFKDFSSGKRIGFQLGASFLSKAWPVENFVELAKLLSKRFESHFILLGSKKERHLAERFKKLYPEKNVLDLVGRVEIKELPYVIKKLDLLVTPDTGPMHLAVCLKVRTVSLFALSKPEDTGPIQDPQLHRVIFKPEGLKWLAKKRYKSSPKAMRLISVKEVEEAVVKSFEN